MRIHISRRGDADHLRQERLVIGDQFARDAPGAENFLAMINIVKEGVDRPYPLLDPAFQPGPLAGRYHPRDDIEGDEPLCRLFAAIDVKGNPGAAKKGLGGGGFSVQSRLVFCLQPLMILVIGIADIACLPVHFIKNILCFLHLTTVEDLCCSAIVKFSATPELLRKMRC